MKTWWKIPPSGKVRKDFLKANTYHCSDSDFAILDKWLYDNNITHIGLYRYMSPKQLSIFLNTGKFIDEYGLDNLKTVPRCDWYEAIFDHVKSFKRESWYGTKFYMMCSPYLTGDGKLSPFLIERMKHAFKHLGIELSVEDKSWYYPGCSTTIVLTSVDDNILNSFTDISAAIKSCGKE